MDGWTPAFKDISEWELQNMVTGWDRDQKEMVIDDFVLTRETGFTMPFSRKRESFFFFSRCRGYICLRVRPTRGKKRGHWAGRWNLAVIL